ncbi:hypothetical protein ACQ1PF_09685 [Ornithobacterium rhinotracheale]
MIYNAENRLDTERAKQRLDWLIENKKSFELTEKKPKRSISQNSYLHLILGWFAVETGYTLEEVKQEIFKKHVNAEIFYDGEFEGKVKAVSRWRSSANLDSKEMTIAIDRFRNFASAELGIYLPEPSDIMLINEMQRELSRNQIYR